MAYKVDAASMKLKKLCFRELTLLEQGELYVTQSLRVVPESLI